MDTYTMRGLYVVIRDDSGFDRIHHVCTRETIVGRASDCGLWLPDLLVSRRHSLFLKTDDGHLIRDLGSRNGTQLDGKMIQCEVRINDGAEIQIGPYLLKVCFDLATALRESSNSDESTRSNPYPVVDHCKNESRVRKLSPAQRRVYDLLLEGRSEKEVAVRLGISVHTVHFHAKSIYKVLSVSTRGELILRWATQSGRETSDE